MTRLEQKLRRTREKAGERMPESALEVLDAHSARLEKEGRAQRAVGEGDRAPDFSLPSTGGGEVQLSDLVARGPVILNFYRGRW